MSNFDDEPISESDMEKLTLLAYKMQEVYRIPQNTMYDAIRKVHEDFPNIKITQLEAMWKAIDAYVDINVM